MTALETCKGSGDGVDPAKFAPVEALRQLMGNHSVAVHQLQEQTAQAKVAQAMQAGHISGGMRDWALELCRKVEARFDAFISGSPPAFAHLLSSKLDKVHPNTFNSPTVQSGVAASICAQLGLDKGRLSS